MSTEERKLAAIVFTDICGFTELMGSDETKAMALLDQQRALLKPIISNFNGEWLKEIGDGVLISFPSAVKAVTCSLEIQRILAHNSDLTLRIGIHIGDVIKKGGDVFGDGVNIASRLEPLAEPGGICVSERVHEDIKNKPEISTAFQEEQLLKGVDKPIKVYSIFTQMGTAPSPGMDKPVSKPPKSKMPYIAAGIVAGLLVSMYALKQAPDNEPLLVGNSLAIFNFENLSAENNTDRTGQILQELIIADLSGIEGLKVFSSQRLFDIQKQLGKDDSRNIDPSVALNVAKEAGARHMLTGNIISIDNQKRLTANLLSVTDGSITKSRQVAGSDVYAMVDELTAQIRNDIGLKNVDKTLNIDVREKTSGNLTAYNYYLEGVDLLNGGLYNESISALKKSIALDPSFKQAYFKLSLSEWWGQYFQECTETLRKAAELPNVTVLEHRMIRGISALNVGNYFEAEGIFTQLVKEEPDNKEFWYELGEAYFHGGDKILESMDAFERAVELDPYFAIAYVHIFGIYFDRKLYDRGLERIQEYNVLFPNNYKGHLESGWLYLGKGDFVKARQYFEKCLKINPLSHEGIEPFQYMGDYKKAEEVAERIIRADLSDGKYLGANFRLARVKTQQGKMKEAIEITSKALDFNDPSLNFSVRLNLYVMAENYLSLNSTEKAIPIQQKIIGITNKNNILTHLINQFVLAKYYVDLNDKDGYYNTLKEMDKILEGYNHPSASLQNLKTNALALEPLMDNNKIEFSKKITELEGSKIIRDDLYYEGALAFIDNKNFEKALTFANHMQDPTIAFWAYPITYPLGFYVRGLAYEGMGNAAKAEESYRALLDLWKNADANIPELIDTKKRLSNLKQTS